MLDVLNKYFTVIIQGPLYDISFVIKNYEYYEKLGFNVVLSTYDDYQGDHSVFKNKNVVLTSRKLQGRGEVLTTHSAAVEPYPHPVFYQALTIKAALDRFEPTDYIIKVRTDEFYSDLSQFTKQCSTNPDKMITGTTFFRAKSIKPLCPSDHIVGMTWKNAVKKYNIAYDLFTKYLPIADIDIKRTTTPPERFLFRCFLYNKGVNLNDNPIELMNKFVIGIPNRDLGDYIIRARKKDKTWSNFLEGHMSWDEELKLKDPWSESVDSFNYTPI
jgi:hypothetical protein